jgi:hypothetical protein
MAVLSLSLAVSLSQHIQSMKFSADTKTGAMTTE